MGPKILGGKAIPVPPLSERLPSPMQDRGDIGEPAFPLRVPVVPEGNNSPTAPGRAVSPSEKKYTTNPRQVDVIHR